MSNRPQPVLTLLPPPAQRRPTPYPVDMLRPRYLKFGKTIYVLDFIIAAEYQKQTNAS